MAGAAAGAAVATIRGINVWKTQGIWQFDNDLARRLLIAIYTYRSSLYSVRHPAMSNSEMTLEEEDAKEISHSEARRRGVIEAYVRRWKKHAEKSNELEALLVEADAVWGSELSSLVAALRSLEHELFVYISLHLDAHYRGNTALAIEYREILKTKRDILFDMMNDEDVFRKDFIAQLVPIETYLRTKLGRKS
jgi:hypothetical protein